MGRRRLGRKLQTAEEALIHWRRRGDLDDCEQVTEIRRGIVTPLSFQRGRDLPTGNVTFLKNPAFIIINPSNEPDPENEGQRRPLDIRQGDLFTRLKYHEKPYNNASEKRDYKIPFQQLEPERQDELKDIALTAIHQVITVHSYEEQFNSVRILGDLQT